MNYSTIERLLDSIGEIEDFFIEEAEIADITIIKAPNHKRIAKYGVAGIAVSLGMIVAYHILQPNRITKST